MKLLVMIVVLLGLTVGLAGGALAETPTPAPIEPTPTLTATATPEPTDTPPATSTSTPTATPVPMFQAAQTATPTATDTPTATPTTGPLPATPSDGKFIGLAGQGLETLVEPALFWIGVPVGQTDFTLRIFDGDLGGFWDEHDPNNTVLETQFLLYADPTKSGDPVGLELILSVSSSQLPDDAWATLYNGPVHASAQAPSGNHFYLLVVRWNNDLLSANEFNAFKLEAVGQVSIVPGQWGFVGPPVNLNLDPPLGNPYNLYDGQRVFYFFVPFASTEATFTECDADYRLHPTRPGSPPDDEDDPRLRISPDVRYTIHNAAGQLVLSNITPSGNDVCETRVIPIPHGGLFRWTWYGVDAHNVIFMQSQYETMLADELPLQPGEALATPTPTNTPTATPTLTPTATATGTATATPIPTATPTPPPSPPPPPPPPDPTATPESGAGEPAGAPVASPTPTTTPTPGMAGTPTSRSVDVRGLPRTGDEPLWLVGGLALGLAFVVAGARLRRRA